MHRMLEDKEDGLGATSRPHYAQSMYVSMYMLTYCNLDNCNREWCLIYLSVSGE